MSFLGSAAGAVGGALVGGLVGSWSARQNAALSLNNWKYQQSHAHQLEVEDLKKAGLNPILSATNSQMAGISSVSGSDYGAGQAFSSAIQAEQERQLVKQNKALDVGIENAKLENDSKRLDNEFKRLEIESFLANKQGLKIDSDIAATNARIANDNALTFARIDEINTNIRNSIKLTDAQAAHFYSGAALNDKLADKVVYDILKVVTDTEYQELNIKDLKRVLTDPKLELERKAWLDALKGNNALGYFHTLSLYGSEIGKALPSRIGFGFSRR